MLLPSSSAACEKRFSSSFHFSLSLLLHWPRTEFHATCLPRTSQHHQITSHYLLSVSERITEAITTESPLSYSISQVPIIIASMQWPNAASTHKLTGFIPYPPRQQEWRYGICGMLINPAPSSNLVQHNANRLFHASPVVSPPPWTISSTHASTFASLSLQQTMPYRYKMW